MRKKGTVYPEKGQVIYKVAKKSGGGHEHSRLPRAPTPMREHKYGSSHYGGKKVID